MSDRNRIAWIDSWKGLLIFLVVLGHVVGALSVGVTMLAFLLTKLVRRWLPIALGEK